jgi:hypothetical protein
VHKESGSTTRVNKAFLKIKIHIFHFFNFTVMSNDTDAAAPETCDYSLFCFSPIMTHHENVRIGTSKFLYKLMILK